MNRFGWLRRFAHHGRESFRVWDRRAIATALIVGSLAGYYGAQCVQVPKHKFPQGSISSEKDVKSPRYAEYETMMYAFDQIKQLLKEDQWSSHRSDLESSNTNDYSTHQPTGIHQRPMLVVYPHTTKQVSEIVKICYRYAIPIVPISGGTSIEGNFISTRNGIVISLSQMDKIIQLNQQDLDCTLQAGVGWQDLNEFLKPYRLFLGPDPGPGANIGGMCGTSCSGTNAARYGTMKDNVVNLTVVLPDGTIIKTRQRPRKSSSGYNLTNLFVGSEGTLGIITEVTVKLHITPRFEKVSVISFPNTVDAINMVTQMIQQGIQFNAVELLDRNMIDVINKSGQCKRKWPVTPTLFMKLGGNDERQLSHIIQLIDNISIKNNSVGFAYSKDYQESEELWMARKVGFWSTIEYGKQNISPDVKVWTTDVAVPISKLSKVIEESMVDLKRLGIFNTILGHVGDGNFHAILIYEPCQSAQVKQFSERLVQRAIDNDGTCTGEHGIGMGKRKYLTWELGEDTVALMRRIKMSIDPKRIMNPDKVFSIDEEDVV